MDANVSARTNLPDPVEFLRSSWATRARLQCLLVLCLILLTAAMLRILWGSDGRVDSMGRLLGADFSALWGAGRAALAGDPESAYSLSWFTGHLSGLFGPGAYRLAWSYPPILYFLVVPLATLPYSAALAVWLGAGYAGLVFVVRQIVREPLAWLALAAYPGIYANALQGQSGFLTAALLGGALLALDRRPVLAGMLFAMLLAWKPQFGVLIPLALLAERRWTAMFSAAGFGIALGLLSIALFGWASWIAFFNGLSEIGVHALDRGEMGYHLLQSLFGALRLHNIPLGVAYGAQALLAAGLAALIWRLWAGQADRRLKYAGLIIASMMISPYCLDYDLVLLAPAIAFLVSHGLEKGFGPWEQTTLALAYVMSPLARFSTFFVGFPLGLFSAIILITILLLRVENDRSGGAKQA